MGNFGYVFVYKRGPPQILDNIVLITKLKKKMKSDNF